MPADRPMHRLFALMEQKTKAAIIIPTMGRPCLVQTLQSLAQDPDFPRVEVIVVGEIHDSAVAAALQDLQSAHERIRHLPLSFDTGDSSAKKNAGWRAATAEVVAFLDDDVIVPTGWIGSITAVFSDPAVHLASGPALPPENISRIARLTALALASAASGPVARRYGGGRTALGLTRWSDIIGCNMAWRRDLLEQVAGFDVKFWPGEEMLAAFRAQRLGHRLWLVPQAWLWHLPRPTLAAFCRQMAGYGATRIRLIRGGVAIEPSTLAPAALLALTPPLLIAAVFCRAAALLLIMGALAYMLLTLWSAAGVFRRTRRPGDLLTACAIPWMHLSYGWGQWRELLHPGRDLSLRRRPHGGRKTAAP